MADLDLTNLPASGFQPLTGIKAPNLASAVIQFLFIAAGILFVIVFLVGGVQWIASGGDKEGLDLARRKIKNALIGLTIVLGIYALGGILNATLGVDLFMICFPGPDTPATFQCPSSGIGRSGAVGAPGNISGNKNCVCYNNLGCAATGARANYGDGSCYDCTAGGWSFVSSTGCETTVIQCGTCN